MSRKIQVVEIENMESVEIPEELPIIEAPLLQKLKNQNKSRKNQNQSLRKKMLKIHQPKRKKR